MDSLSTVQAATSHTGISAIGKAVLRTLLYFDVFSYPLTPEEIFHYCDLEGVSPLTIQSEIKSLLQVGLLQEQDGLIAPIGSEMKTERRLAGNQRAEALMQKARRKSKLIGRFPFVRAVMLSGSISKGFVDEDADIDYFIITKPGRLWLARTLLVMYKKVFLLNSYRYFCVNYFIDTSHLSIEEKNLFTAIELRTLIPTYGAEHYEPFLEANQWSKQFLPNAEGRSLQEVPASKVRGFKRFNEFVLSGFLGRWADRVCLRTTLSFWKKKFDHFNDDQFEVALKSRTYVSKHHPHNFQERVMKSFREKIERFENSHTLSLSKD